MRRQALSALVLALLLGCSPGAPPPDGTARPTGAPGTATHRAGPSPDPGENGAGTTLTARLPIARYSYSDDEYLAITAAELILARDCARRYGVTYDPPQATAVLAPPFADRRYGISSAREAARWGYHLPPQPDPASDSTPSAAEQLVLYGRRADGRTPRDATHRGRRVPAHGCLGEGVEKLRKPYEFSAGADAASRIAARSFVRSRQDSRVRAALAEWAACMRKNGFSYASPMDPLKNPAFQRSGISRQEKETARTDIACKRRTRLLETWFEAEARAQRTAIAGDTARLERLRGLHLAKVREARRIVAGADRDREAGTDT
ncbi:hypothetical protein ACIQXD_21925 [Streptomyces uncialis]|uniref:hypothetical protein n=1 Tax=Streptomyces uncialis TaxID=1048205 RepID=UPI00381C949C